MFRKSILRKLWPPKDENLEISTLPRATTLTMNQAIQYNTNFAMQYNKYNMNKDRYN